MATAGSNKLFPDRSKATDALRCEEWIDRWEDLWRKYSEFCDKDFAPGVRDAIDKITSSKPLSNEYSYGLQALHAKYWEVRVVDHLSIRGLRILTKRERGQESGPDICLLVENAPVWIECVTATPGIGVNAVEWPEGTVGVPEDKVRLRQLSALQEKRRRRWEQQIAKTNEPFLIALNDYLVPFTITDARDESLPPRIARSLFGVGGLAVSWSLDNDEELKPFLTHRPTIQKAGTEATISSSMFADDQASDLTGVIYSVDRLYDSTDHDDNRIALVTNSFATARVSPGWLKNCREYVLARHENQSQIQFVDHS